MADLRAKNVLSKMIDLSSRNFYALDVASTPMREPLGKGDTIEIGSVDDLTVRTAGSSAQTPQAVTNSLITLVADREPWINALIPQMASMQLVDGNWADHVAEKAVVQLKNYIDREYQEHIIAQAWVTGTASTYHTNVGSDTLSSIDILNAKATLLSNDGSMEQSLVLLVHPYGEASIRSISTFVPNATDAEMGNLGITKLGRVHNVPVFMTTSVHRRRTVASTAWSVTSNVLTITVASGHGIVAGVPITFDTVTAGGDQATSTAVTSTTATTVVLPLTASNGSATEAGTITVQACENLLIDRGHAYSAIQKGFGTRIVPQSDTTGDALQISSIWGRIARAGRANVLCSPPASA